MARLASQSRLLEMTDRGLYCAAGDFHIDPWLPVDRAVVTHAHGDHARWGSRSYLGSAAGERVLRARLGADAHIESVEYGEVRSLNGVRVSMHPAGHILGSAQVRVEHAGEVWVASGDYKTEPDRTCTPFEPVRCHHFITESTFGLPIYRWPPEHEVMDDLLAWWTANQALGRVSVVYAWALGKSQRLLAGLHGRAPGPILTHGAVERMTREYRASGVELAPTTRANDFPKGPEMRGALVIAPPSAAGTTWLRRFGELSAAFASGWMRVRGARRRRGLDRGFVVSDHVDWPALLAAIEATGAEQVWVTHGYREPVVRWLRERGLGAQSIASQWEGESAEAAEDAADTVADTAPTAESEP